MKTNNKMTREKWIAKVRDLVPDAIECTPVRNDMGNSVVFRRENIEVDAKWRYYSVYGVAKALYDGDLERGSYRRVL